MSAVSITSHVTPDIGGSKVPIRRLLRLLPENDLNVAIAALGTTASNPGTIELAVGTSYHSHSNSIVNLTSGLTIRGIEGKVEFRGSFIANGVTGVVLENISIFGTRDAPVLEVLGSTEILLRGVDLDHVTPQVLSPGIGVLQHTSGNATITFESDCVFQGHTKPTLAAPTAGVGILNLQPTDASNTHGTYRQNGGRVVVGTRGVAAPGGAGGTADDISVIEIHNADEVDFHGTLMFYGQMVISGDWSGTAVGAPRARIYFHEVIANQYDTSLEDLDALPPVALAAVGDYDIMFGQITAIRDSEPAGGSLIGIVTVYEDNPPATPNPDYLTEVGNARLSIGTTFVPLPGGYPNADSNATKGQYLDDTTMEADDLVLLATGNDGDNILIVADELVPTGDSEITIRNDHGDGTDAIHLDANAGGLHLEGNRVDINAIHLDAPAVRGGIHLDADTDGGSVVMAIDEGSAPQPADGGLAIAVGNNSATAITGPSSIAIVTGGVTATNQAAATGAINIAAGIARSASSANQITVQAAGVVDVTSAAEGTSALSLVGTNGGVLVQSLGTTADEVVDLHAVNTATNAIQLRTSGTGGGILLDATMDNAFPGVTGANTGPVSLVSSGVASSWNHSSGGPDGISIAVAAGTAGVNPLALSSAGTTAGSAITLSATGIAGGISIAADSGPTNGDLLLTSQGVASGWTHTATANEALTVAIDGGGASTMVLRSQGTGTNAIDIDATAGGLDIDVATGVNINTTGTGNIVLDATGGAGLGGGGQTGALILASRSAASSWNHSSNGADGISIAVAAGAAGANPLALSSAGTTAASAITLSATGAAGGITIAADSGTTAGDLQLTSRTAASGWTHTATAGENLTIALAGAGGAQSLALTSTGTGTNAISLAAAAGGINLASANTTSAWTHTPNGAGDDLTLSVVSGGTDASLILVSDGIGTDAVSLLATGAAGDILIDATGGPAGANGVTGAINLNSNGEGGSGWTQRATAGGHGLTFQVTDDGGGPYATSLALTSAGTGQQAIVLATSSTTGGISLTADSGATSGPLVLTSRGVASSWTHTSVGTDGLTINSTGGAAQSLAIQGDGTGATAVNITAPTNNGGITVDSSAGNTVSGAIALQSRGTTSSWTHTAVNTNDDLTFIVDGSADAHLVINSTGTSVNALQLIASDGTGGIDMDAGSGGVRIDTIGGPFIVGQAGGVTTAQITATAAMILSSTEAAANAVTIRATDTAGGVRIDAGTGGTGLLDVNTGTGGIDIDAAGGTIAIDNVGPFTLGAASATTTIGLTAQAAGTAISLTAANAAGGVSLTSGTGGITVNAGAGVLDFDTTAAYTLNSAAHTTVGTGAMSVTSTGGTATFGSTGGAATFTSSGLATLSGLGVAVTATGAGSVAVTATGNDISLDSSTLTATHTGLVQISGAAGMSLTASVAPLLLTGTGQPINHVATGQDINFQSGTLTSTQTGTVAISSTGGNLTLNGNGNAALTADTGTASLVASAGGVAVTATGAGNDVTITAPDDINLAGASLTGALTGANGISLAASGGNATLSSSSGNATLSTTNAGNDVQLTSAAGSVAISSSENTAAEMSLTATGGIASTLSIRNTLGTGTDAITLLADAGGITLDADGAAITLDAAAISFPTAPTFTATSLTFTSTAGAITLDSNGGDLGLNSDNDITIISSDGTAFTTGGNWQVTSSGTGAEAVEIKATHAAGQISVDAAATVADAILLQTSSTTAGNQTIRLHSEAGNTVDSIHLESDDGGIHLQSGFAGVGKAIHLQATDAAGDIHIETAATVTEAILIEATAGTATTIEIKNNLSTAADAIRIEAQVGGVTIDASTFTFPTSTTSTAPSLTFTSTTGDIALTSADNIVLGSADNIQLTTTDGSITLDANGAANGDITINAADDLDIDATGPIAITSASATADAILIETSNAAGKIQIDSAATAADAILLHASGATNANTTIRVHNDNSTSVDSIHLVSDTGGIHALTGQTAVNAIHLESTDAAGTIYIQSDGTVADSILIEATTGTASTLHLKNTQGTSATAIQLESTAGGVTLGAATTVTATATLGAMLLTSVAGTLDVDANGGLLTLTGDTGVTMSTTGGTNIEINATAGGGGDIRVTGADFDVDTSIVNIDSTAGTMILTATGGAATLTSDTGTNVTSTGGALTLTAAAAASFTATTGDMAVKATAGTLTLEAPNSGDVIVTRQTVPTIGSGISSNCYWHTHVSGGPAAATVVHTSQLLIDLDNLRASGTTGDVIGDTGAANCHFGQLNTAVLGANLFVFRVECVELPSGGATTIGFSSNSLATLAEDVDYTSVGTDAVIIAPGAYVAGTVAYGYAYTNLHYLYLTSGGAGETYTAGKFLVTIVAHA